MSGLNSILIHSKSSSISWTLKAQLYNEDFALKQRQSSRNTYIICTYSMLAIASAVLLVLKTAPGIIFNVPMSLLTNQNSIQDEIKCALTAGDSCYYLVQMPLSSRLL